VTNLGQQASQLVVTDSIPINTAYVDGSASSGGKMIGGTLAWEFPLLAPGERNDLIYKVNVLGGDVIVNDQYSVVSSEGISATGETVTTTVITPIPYHFLPLIQR
jgi:hypothetical protein